MPGRGQGRRLIERIGMKMRVKAKRLFSLGLIPEIAPASCKGRAKVKSGRWIWRSKHRREYRWTRRKMPRKRARGSGGRSEKIPSFLHFPKTLWAPALRRPVSNVHSWRLLHPSYQLPPPYVILSHLLKVPDLSQDLLKCIHHFASNHYTERHQLFNGSKQYREEKRERRLRRQSSLNAPSTPDYESTSENLSSDDHEEPATDEHGSPNSTKYRRPGRDMYKIMDGSALMAIGWPFTPDGFGWISYIQTPRNVAARICG